MSCSTTRRTDVQFEAATGRWGRAQCREITPVADSSGDLQDTYFDLNLVGYDFVEAQYYVYIGTDPAITGKTGIEATVAADATALEVAAAIKTAIDDADLPVFVTNNSGVLDVENQVIGEITEETDSGSTGFNFEVGALGLMVELGSTSGAIEVSFSVESTPITANQTGGLVVSEIYQGSGVEVTMPLIEITKERFDVLVGEVTGGSVTPGGGTKVSGFGESRLFQALDVLGGKLILHPIRLPESDKSSDIVIHRSAPKVTSLNFDGTAAQEMPVTFTGYLDSKVDTAINLFAKGDWTQKGLRA